jgi:uncharacterized membrane protein YhaH (DUF805 family)/TPR repeat protein
MSTLELLFSFRGRIGRRLFWLGILIPVCIITIPLNFLTLTQNYSYIIFIFCYLIITWIGIAGFTKRLHDYDQSGWLQLFFYIPAAATYTLSTLNYNQHWVITSGYISFLIGLWISIKLVIKRGTVGQNRYGKDRNQYSIKNPLWVINLNFLTKRSINNDQKPTSVNTSYKKSSKNGLLTSSVPDKKSDVLGNWLGNAKHYSIQEETPKVDEKPKILGNLDGTLSMAEPEILRATNSVFSIEYSENNSKIDGEGIKPTPKNALPQIVGDTLNSDIETIPTTTNVTQESSTANDYILKSRTEGFLNVLKKRATKSLTHQRYLQNTAESGNSWAKLEISATWLSNTKNDKDQAQRAINYLSELANSSQTHLGAETEASYFLGEIYRIGLRYTRPNEDLSFKYLIRAAALGHKKAQHNLAAELVHTVKQENKNPLTLSLIHSALQNAESATALMQLIEFDWSITYIESVSLVLRTLVDQGDSQAARFLGRMLLERNDYDIGARILNLADKLDDMTIDKIIEIIKGAQTSENTINSLVDIIRKHAKLDNSYAHYQIALAFNEGIGMPQDKMMAFVHITMASARVYGHERDQLVKLRDELSDVLTEEEIVLAQKIIRGHYSS